MENVRMAVSGGHTYLLTKERFTDGDELYFLYDVDEEWNPERESFAGFCERNISDGCSEDGSREELERKFEEKAGDGEYDRWTLVDYFDVWGNPKDGFEVNNLDRTEGFFLPKDVTDEQLIVILGKHGMLNETASVENILIDDSGDGMIEFSEAKTSLPLCRFEVERFAEKKPEGTKVTEQMVSVCMPFTWQLSGTGRVDVPVHAGDSVEEVLEKALDIALNDSDHIPLPGDANYVDGSFEPVVEDAEDLDFYNQDLEERLKRIFGR